MKVNINKYYMFIMVLHFFLGLIMTNKIYSIFITHILFLIAVISVVVTKNKNNEALFWGFYFIGFEMLARMSKGLLFYESFKYVIIVIFLIGLFIEKTNNKPVPLIYILYLLLLSIGVVFSDIPAGESIRKAVAFNLSGPVVLGVSAIYNFHRKISMENMLKLIWIGILPLLSILSFLYLKTPDLDEIRFGGTANFEASGGFGPNQVATILGFGMFLMAALLILRKRITGFLLLDIFLVLYITYRGLLTFSRGGMVTAFLALGILALFYFLAQPHKLYTSIKYMVLAVVLAGGVLLYTSGITGGMLVNRYTNKNVLGEKKEDITSGRADILQTDFQYFYENPVFGIGVGSGKYYRMEDYDDLNPISHNEVGRLLSEHGIIGLLSLVILMIIPLYHLKQVDTLNKGFVFAFYVFWFLTINHSAMRVAFPGFVYGLSLLTIIPNRQPTTEKIE